MKVFVTICFLVSSVLMNTAMATNYSCVNISKNVELTVTFTNPKTAEIELKNPIQKTLTCEVNDFTNGLEVVKGFVCENGEELPEIAAINEKLMTGMIELSDQSHYDFDCK